MAVSRFMMHALASLVNDMFPPSYFQESEVPQVFHAAQTSWLTFQPSFGIFQSAFVSLWFVI